MTSLKDFYNVNPYEPLDWTQWYIPLNADQKDTLTLLRRAVKTKFEANSIHMHFVALPFDEEQGGVYWVDLPWDVVQERYEIRKIKNYLNIPFVIVVLKLTTSGHLNIDKGLTIQHNLPGKTNKKTVQKIMKHAFGNRFQWDGSDEQVLWLKL